VKGILQPIFFYSSLTNQTSSKPQKSANSKNGTFFQKSHYNKTETQTRPLNTSELQVSTCTPTREHEPRKAGSQNKRKRQHLRGLGISEDLDT